MAFSEAVTLELKVKGATFITEEVKCIPDSSSPIIISTGPLTSPYLALDISSRYKITNYSFHDVSCPIIDGTSIDFNNPYLKKISNDLFAINIPQDCLFTFVRMLQASKEWDDHIPKDNNDYFILCHSLEKLAKQNYDILCTMRFSPEGYTSPTILLRRETSLRDAFILVGCMTGLGQKEQKEIFSLLPALANIRFVRYGRQHRNTFFQAPEVLDNFFRIKNRKNDTFLVGQLSGLDGYAPAIASGYIAAQRIIKGNKTQPLPRSTMIGELARYVSDTTVVDYRPMCASFALFNEPRKENISSKALHLISQYTEKNP